MFTVRPYREEDATACGECFYEGFFTCPIDENDKKFLRDYAQVLTEKCNFTYVAETKEHQIVGFISGIYYKDFSKALAAKYELKKHYGQWIAMFLKFYFKGYKLSEAFQKQFDDFFRQARERDKKTFGRCDLELVALSSKKDYRKGLGTTLLTRFLERGKKDGADSVRLFTNSLVSWEFYEKHGFKKVAEKPFKWAPKERSIIYEYRLKEMDQA